MDNLKTISLSILDGVVDSIKNISVIFYIDKTINKKLEGKEQERLQRSTTSSTSSSSTKKSNKEKKEKKSNVAFRVMQCCLLNGGLFLLSIIFFDNLLLPLMEMLVTRFTDASIWNWIQLTLSWIFSCIWVIPLFILSKIFNFFWFQDIADGAYVFRRGNPTLLPSISLLLADIVFSLIVESLFICQGMLLGFVPYLGKILCFVHISLLYSLYSFEYKWFNQGYELHRRLKLVEYNWPYYLGFGMILALLTELSDSFVIKGCIFSMFFPLLIISSIDSAPKQRIDFPIQFFWLVVALPNSVVSRKLKQPTASNRSSTTPTRR